MFEIAPSLEKLEKINSLINSMLLLETDISKKEDELSLLKEEHRKLSEKTIPELILECGVDAMDLTNGFRVSVKESMFASIPKDNLPNCLKWLRKNNFSEIIQNTLTVHIGKGLDNKTPLIKETCNELGLPFEESEKINTGTVKSLLKDMYDKGESPPLDMFGAFIARKTKLKQIKQPKVRVKQ